MGGPKADVVVGQVRGWMADSGPGGIGEGEGSGPRLSALRHCRGDPLPRSISRLPQRLYLLVRPVQTACGPASGPAIPPFRASATSIVELSRGCHGRGL